MKILQKSLMSFSAGACGGLINSLAVYFAGSLGLAALIGVGIAPSLTLSWLYPRLVWGGIWGLLFVIPFLKSSILLRAFLISLAPSAVQLFWIFPQAGAGIAGQDLGTLTPLLVLLYNWIWGLTAALLLCWARK